MEGSGESVTMSAGVVSPVNGFGRGEASGSPHSNTGVSQRSSRSESAQKPISISEYRDSKNAREMGPVEPKAETGEIVGEEVSKIEKVNRKTRRILAEDIFESAKRDGIDKTFLRLANGDFADEEKIREEEKERTEKPGETILRNEKSGPGEFQSEKEISPLEAQVIALEARVDELMQENRELSKKVAEAQEMAKNGIATALELAKILKQIIEDEEEEKKKKHKGLLELIAKLIAQMLIMVTVPDSQVDEALSEFEEKAA